MQNRLSKSSSPVFQRLWTKVPRLSNVYIIVRSEVAKSLKNVKNTQFWGHNLQGREHPKFNLAHFRTCRKVCLSSVWWALKAADEQKRNLKMWQLTLYCHWKLPDATSLLT